MARLNPSIIRFLDEILSTTEELDSHTIYNRLYIKVEERRNDTHLGYYKGHEFPSKLRMVLFLKQNFQWEYNEKKTMLFWK